MHDERYSPYTSPNAELLQLVYDELIEIRARLQKIEERLQTVERVGNGLQMSVELMQEQYQSNGSAIANIQRMCRRRGELISRLISKSSQPPPSNEESGGTDGRRRSKT